MMILQCYQNFDGIPEKIKVDNSTFFFSGMLMVNKNMAKFYNNRKDFYNDEESNDVESIHVFFGKILTISEKFLRNSPSKLSTKQKMKKLFGVKPTSRARKIKYRLKKATKKKLREI